MIIYITVSIGSNGEWLRMKENFDCTQFITFNLEKDKNILDSVVDEFSKIGFHVILDIRDIKKVYFKEYLGEYFIELKDDNFMGEFEDWELENEPPKRIKDFMSVVKKIIKRKNIKNFTVMLTYFAEIGDSTNKVINVDSSNIQQGLFSMSRYNYDYCVDNLILKISI